VYAVVKTGGKQHRVAEGDVVVVERLDGDVGETVELAEVIMLGTDKGAVADKGKLAKVKIHATILDQYKDEKVIVFKFKRRKGYKRTRGHRQPVTKLAIDFIDDGSGRKAKPKEAAKAETKPAAAAPKAAKPAKKTPVKKAAAGKKAAAKAASAEKPKAEKKAVPKKAAGAKPKTGAAAKPAREKAAAPKPSVKQAAKGSPKKAASKAPAGQRIPAKKAPGKKSAPKGGK
jgi:large subunit ribosomal protein L21